jgi:hypothetical protein
MILLLNAHGLKQRATALGGAGRGEREREAGNMEIKLNAHILRHNLNVKRV